MVVIAAIDGEAGSKRVIEEAAALATAFGEPLEVIFVYEGTSHADRVNEYANVAEDPDEEEAIGFAEGVIDDLASELSIEYEPVGLTGDPAEEVLAYAGSVDARYLVVGGRAQSPVGKALFGSVTQSVLLDSDRPVLTVVDQ